MIMRGKKVKEMRKSNLPSPNPHRVICRIEILVDATGHVNVKNFPANEAATRAIMVNAMKALDAYYKIQAQGPMDRYLDYKRQAQGPKESK
jgi:hypothetical protein